MTTYAGVMDNLRRAGLDKTCDVARLRAFAVEFVAAVNAGVIRSDTIRVMVHAGVPGITGVPSIRWETVIDEHSLVAVDALDCASVTDATLEAMTAALCNAIGAAVEAKRGSIFDPRTEKYAGEVDHKVFIDEGIFPYIRDMNRTADHLAGIFNKDVSLLAVPGVISREIASATLVACYEALSDCRPDLKMTRRDVAVKVRMIFMDILVPRVGREHLAEWLDSDGYCLRDIDPRRVPIHLAVSRLMEVMSSLAEREETSKVCFFVAAFGARMAAALMLIWENVNHAAFDALESFYASDGYGESHSKKEGTGMKKSYGGCVWSKVDGERGDIVFTFDGRMVATNEAEATAVLWLGYVFGELLEHLDNGGTTEDFDTPSITEHICAVECLG